MPPLIVNQAKTYSQYLHYNIPMYWIVHRTPYGYMYRDVWLKAMAQLPNKCGTSPVNNKILFFDVHGRHFNDRALRKMMCKNIQPFVLKSSNSINNQPNDNGPNTKLKSLYNVAKSVCMLEYGTTQFPPHHMNSVLVEA